MPQWLVDIVGESLAPIVWVAIVALVVCLLAIVVILLARKALGGIGGGGFKTRAPRLAVMDVARIDEKRRLVLVRRDEVEHLVLVGGQTDILLEGNILRVPTSRSRAEPQLDRLPEPDDSPAMRRWDAPSNGDERQTRPNVAPPPAPARHEQLPAAQNGEAVEPRAEAAPSPVATPAPAPVIAPPRPVASKRDAAPMPDSRRAEPDTVRTPPRPPVPPVQPIQPRSMATPTLPVPVQREETSASPAPQPSPAASSQGTGRVEPSLSMPDPHSTPEMSRQRAELRERLNRTPPLDLPRAPAATAPSVALDKPADAPLERRPLSVRSFATAIQNRGAPLEPQAPAVPPKPAVASAPPVIPASPVTSLEEPSATPASEPSLEDFLSAELDAELSREDAAHEQATPARQETKAGPATVSASTEPAHQPAPLAPGAGMETGPEPKRDAPQSPSIGESTAPARKLTLEEEMERLLGDFSFVESDRRDRG